MVQWFDKSSSSSGSYKDSVKSLAQSFANSPEPERKPTRFNSSRKSCYGSITSSESNSFSTPHRSNDSALRRVTSPAYSQSTNSSDGCSEYGSYSNYSSRPSTPVMSYSVRNSRASTPVGSNPMRSYSTASSRTSSPIRFYQNPLSARAYNGYTSRESSPAPTKNSLSARVCNGYTSHDSSPAPTKNSLSARVYNGYTSRDSSPAPTKKSSRYEDMALPTNPSSRSTTPMRSFYTPSSRASTPLGSYYNSSSRSGTPMRSHNEYVSRDSSPTPTISAPNEHILNPIQNRRSSSKNRDLPLPKSRKDILVPLKYYFTDVPNTLPTSQRCRSSSRSRSSCNGDDSSQINRSSSRSRSTCNGDIPQSRPRDVSLPRPKTLYSSTESSRNESDLNTLPRLSMRRGSYIETNSRSSSVTRDMNSRSSSLTRDMYGSSESLQHLINLPPTKDIETRVRASMRAKLILPSTNSDNIRSRKARSQYLSGVISGNTYQDESGGIYVLN